MAEIENERLAWLENRAVWADTYQNLYEKELTRTRKLQEQLEALEIELEETSGSPFR